jgi:uncharacterized protein (DUF1330 family)
MMALRMPVDNAERRAMAAYIIAQVQVTDPATFEQYRAQVPAVIAQYGGRYLVRGGQTAALEGEWNVPRLVVLEFPSMEALKRFYRSAEYAPLIALRQQSARSVLVAVEGV